MKRIQTIRKNHFEKLEKLNVCLYSVAFRFACNIMQMWLRKFGNAISSLDSRHRAMLEKKCNVNQTSFQKKKRNWWCCCIPDLMNYANGTIFGILPFASSQKEFSLKTRSLCLTKCMYCRQCSAQPV